jgi:ABC-2 type transport system ATP-binding protein
VLARNQIVARQLRVEQASLEDAFVALTGRRSGTGQNARPCPDRRAQTERE